MQKVVRDELRQFCSKLVETEGEKAMQLQGLLSDGITFQRNRWYASALQEAIKTFYNQFRRRQARILKKRSSALYASIITRV